MSSSHLHPYLSIHGALARKIVERGVAGNEHLVEVFARTAAAAGVSTVLTGILADREAPEAVRARAFDRIRRTLMYPPVIETVAPATVVETAAPASDPAAQERCAERSADFRYPATSVLGRRPGRQAPAPAHS